MEVERLNDRVRVLGASVLCKMIYRSIGIYVVFHPCGI